jgi:hypothetical protein
MVVNAVTGATNKQIHMSKNFAVICCKTHSGGVQISHLG